MVIYIDSASALNGLMAMENGDAVFGVVYGHDDPGGTSPLRAVSVSLPGSVAPGEVQVFTSRDLVEVKGLFNDILQGVGDDTDLAIVSEGFQIGVVRGLIQPVDPTVLTQPLPGNEGGVVTDVDGNKVV